MGLWLKCPGCQANNPLSLKICPTCGQDLAKLAVSQRVYVIGPATVSAPAPAPATPPAAAAATEPTAPSPEAAPTSQAAKKPKRTKKKKG